MSRPAHSRYAGVALCVVGLVASACSSTSAVTVSADVQTQAGGAPVANSEGSGATDDGGLTAAEANLDVAFEPNHALLDSIDGWTAVDTWYHEPLGVPPTPTCEPLDVVLSLENWGITTALWLRDGDELWQHAADLNTEDNAAAYVDAFGTLAAACSSQSTGSGPLVIETLGDATWPGFALTASDKTQATWLFEPGSRSRSVVLSRGNVVSIVSVVTNDPPNPADLVDAAMLAQQRLDAMVPESSAQQEQEPAEPAQPNSGDEPGVEPDPQPDPEPNDEADALEAPPEPRPLADYLPLPASFSGWAVTDDRFRPNEASDVPSTPCTSDPLFTAIDTMPNHFRQWEVDQARQIDGQTIYVGIRVGIDVAREEWPGQAAAISAWYGEFCDRCFAELQPFPIVGSQYPLDLTDFPQLSGTGFTFYDVYNPETDEFQGRSIFALLSADDLVFRVTAQFEVLGFDQVDLDVADLWMTNGLEIRVLPRVVEHLERIDTQE